jgi:hypothetical protein
VRRSLLFAVGLAACAGGAAETPEPKPTATECSASIEIGTGSTAFTGLADDDTLSMVHGAQGGYHVPLAVLGCAVGQSAEMHFSGTLGSGDPVVDVDLDYPWMPRDACCSLALDIYGYLYVADTGISAPDLAGEPMDLTVDIRDSSGASFTDRVHVVLGAPL